MRGKLGKEVTGLDAFRITPAGAGKTFGCYLNLPFGQDHPRRCGENAPAVDFDSDSDGSPPQVRGKHPVAQKAESALGITPAGAGKT